MIDSDGNPIGRGKGTFMPSNISLAGLAGYAAALCRSICAEA